MGRETGLGRPHPAKTGPLNTDVIVIGSGFGGSVVAARAAQAGLRVRVLERGGPLDPDQWEQIRDGRLPLLEGGHSNGPLDVHVHRGLGALTGNALGGGSRIYTSVTMRPRPEIFNAGWPAGVSLPALGPCYDRVESELRPRSCPDALSRIQFMERVGRAARLPVTRLPLAVDWDRLQHAAAAARHPSDRSMTAELADWFRGTGGMKRSLDQTYLRSAHSSGAVVQLWTSVNSIEPLARGFRVYFRSTNGGGSPDGSLSARFVVIAAGTLNTLRLLFINRDVHRTLPNLSRRLGDRFFTNGDRGALVVNVNHEWSCDSAPPAIGWFDQWEAGRFFIMDLGRSPIVRGPLTSAISCIARGGPGNAPNSAKHGFGDFDGAWLLGVMGWDEAPRRLVHTGRGRYRCIAEASPAHSNEDRVSNCIAAIANAAGGRWQMVPAFIERRMPMTVHPLGGASLADSPKAGVTDPHGEVFGHPGLFIADGSLLPTPTGVPPSMTIAALAERVAARVVESAR